MSTWNQPLDDPRPIAGPLAAAPVAGPLVWDNGKLLVDRAHADLLAGLGLRTLGRFLRLTGDAVRRIDSRETVRIELPGESGCGESKVAVYLKRHGRPTWRERLIPWLRLSRPILGARGEWEALLRFHALGLPTMDPVAFGEDRSVSFVMTRELSSQGDLKAWAGRASQRGWQTSDRVALRRLTGRLADIVRGMHSAGLHHQDLYLNHVLWCGDMQADRPDLRLIDLGRVRHHSRLARRWIIKDLAQLNFSAELVPCTARLRFLRLYLGRPFQRSDRWLIARIRLKSAQIGRHSRKHAL